MQVAFYFAMFVGVLVMLNEGRKIIKTGNFWQMENNDDEL